MGLQIASKPEAWSSYINRVQTRIMPHRMQPIPFPSRRFPVSRNARDDEAPSNRYPARIPRGSTVPYIAAYPFL
jgi:hypothetical protein